MALSEKKYERHLLQELPPNARDVAEFLFSNKPLLFFLKQQATAKVDHALLEQSKVSPKLWPEIIQAALLAKITYFEPNPNLTAEQLEFLMEKACDLVNMPMQQLSVEQIIELTHNNMTWFAKWLHQMSAQRKKLTQRSK